MSRIRKHYSFAGFAGCVVIKASPVTGSMVGVYSSEQSGMESDPEYPWSTVCEVHNSCVCHHTLKLAFLAVRDSSDWCEACCNFYEVWASKTRLSVMPKTSVHEHRRKGLLKGMKPVYSINAPSWEDAMRAHHQIQGWAPYVPMEASQ